MGCNGGLKGAEERESGGQQAWEEGEEARGYSVAVEPISNRNNAAAERPFFCCSTPPEHSSALRRQFHTDDLPLVPIITPLGARVPPSPLRGGRGWGGWKRFEDAIPLLYLLPAAAARRCLAVARRNMGEASPASFPPPSSNEVEKMSWGK